jgi:hypothetical protein
LALDGGGWSTLCTGRSTPRERPGTHCIVDRAGPTAGLDEWGKSRLHRNSIPESLARGQSLCRLSYPSYDRINKTDNVRITLRHVRATNVAVENKYYIFWGCVCSPSIRAILSFVACTALQYFSTFAHNGTIFGGEELLNIWNMCFDYLSNFCPLHFSV